MLVSIKAKNFRQTSMGTVDEKEILKIKKELLLTLKDTEDELLNFGQ